jgi:hypothetical protein
MKTPRIVNCKMVITKGSLGVILKKISRTLKKVIKFTSHLTKSLIPNRIANKKVTTIKS